MATTGMCCSFKSESAFQGGHCFLATQSGVSCSGSNGAFTLTGLASTANLAVGMAVTGTNVGAGAVIAAITSASAVTLSVANTGSVTSVTFTADVFKMLLVKVSPSLTYSYTQTNVGTPGSGSPTTSNVGTDEVSGTGYTSGGQQVTNQNPAVDTTQGVSSTGVAYLTFGANPSWTSSSFSTTAGILYNNSTRLGAAATPLNGRTVAVYDFGGTQTVTSGTFTIVLPTNNSSSAVLRIA